MNSINFKNTKNKTKINKSRIVFIMSVIFIVTSILTQIYNTCVILKENKNNTQKGSLKDLNNHILKKEIKIHTNEINYILDISDTLGEAISYIQQNYKNDTNLQVKIVLDDSIAGINSVNTALEEMSSNLHNKNINVETANLAALFNELINSLTENNIEMVETIINSKLSNEYNHWKTNIEDEFR